MNASTHPVANPTYMGDIRHMFIEEDLEHMRSFGIDLGSYEGVRFNALRTYFRLEEKSMPPGRPWPAEQIETFYNWMKTGYPRGEGARAPVSALRVGGASRVRCNLAELSAPEVAKVRDAFAGMMARDSNDPTSYFQLAGLHWLPLPDVWCRHHENAYNPWHRLYLMRFEDAMRSVPGCADVTLPYWDIASGDIPDILYEEPFAAYDIPVDLTNLSGHVYKAGPTVRLPKDKVLANIAEYGIPQNIAEALGHSHWEQFNGWDGGRTQDGIIKAHDNGHNSCGETMENQDVAAFDPIFWFFHSNWDRLWWQWQQSFGATTVDTFRTHLVGKPDWLDDPVLNKLPPFGLPSPATIDLRKFDVDYAHPPAATARMAAATPPRFGSMRAAAAFTMPPEPRVSVRVKGVDRLEIPGSFDVLLTADGERIGRQGFFQSTEPKQCATCRKNALVHFDFVVDADRIAGRTLGVTIMFKSRWGGDVPFPLEKCGDPTINIRHLLATAN